MDDSTPTWPRTTCEMTRCTRREVGHAVHRIQLGSLDSTPWLWRSGVVRSSDVTPEGQVVVVHYVEQDVDVTVLHHLPLPVEPGDVVAVHERHSCLEYDDHWRSVSVVAGGLGSVAAPADPTTYPRRRSGRPDSQAAYHPG